jgi:hypothetical protein
MARFTQPVLHNYITSVIVRMSVAAILRKRIHTLLRHPRGNSCSCTCEMTILPRSLCGINNHA